MKCPLSGRRGWFHARAHGELSEGRCERMMKVQEVICGPWRRRFRGGRRRRFWASADRQMRRWRARYEHLDYDGLMDRRRGKPERQAGAAGHGRRGAAALPGAVFRSQREPFSREAEPGARHRAELYVVKQALQGAGLVAREAQRGVHRKRRERRPLLGCCCISTAANTSGFRTNAGMT